MTRTEAMLPEFIGQYSESSQITNRSIIKQSGIISYVQETGKDLCYWDYCDIEDFMCMHFARNEKGKKVIKTELSYTNQINVLVKFFFFVTGDEAKAKYFRISRYKKEYFKDIKTKVYATYDDIERAIRKLNSQERLYFMIITRFLYLGGDTYTLLTVTEKDLDREKRVINIPMEGKYIQIDDTMIDMFDRFKDCEYLGKPGVIVPMVDGALFGLSLKSVDANKPPLNIAIKRMTNVYRRLKDKAGIELDIKNVKYIGILDKIQRKYPQHYHIIFSDEDSGRTFMNEINEIVLEYGVTERTFKVVYKKLKDLYDLRKITA